MRFKHFLPFLVLALFASEACALDAMTPGDVIASFRQYESLNADLASATGCECAAQQLRAKVEQYAEGPLEHALYSAVQLVCGAENAEMLHALFHVALATSDAGSESPAWSLGRSFVCKPALVEKEFKALEQSQQRSLHESLTIGFENAVYERPDAQEAAALRARLHSLAPAAE
ncbi:MAG TPA: hypothetical protein VKO83_07070 [Steroidobacteraceae bacterium]|nr:hypothetical protein [Steroidobacteraceae bacterium]